MEYTESDYIELCKKLLEEKFSFGNAHGHSQKDLELLSNYIEAEKGINISLSTLKRLWKNKFKQGPQLATLNALVSVLGYDSWQHFKLQNNSGDYSKAIVSKGHGVKNRGKYSKMVKVGLLLSTLVFIIWLLVFFRGSYKPISINGPVIFNVDKTLTKGVPNTFIFKYDVSNVEADSFFIQQSWNEWRKERINPKQHVFSSIYYESGFHRARLIANDSTIDLQPIHILSDGWEPHVYHDLSDERFMDFKGEFFITNGMLHISQELLDKRDFDTSEYFETRISNSQRYNISSNNFNLTARTKLDKISYTNCPWVNILIVTEVHIFSVKLIRKGCETYAEYKLGEIYRHGKDNDLRLLGQDIFEWQEVGIKVKDKNAEITINGKSAYTEKFKKDFGEIMGLTFIFEGKGSVDHVKLTDVNGNNTFEDNFER